MKLLITLFLNLFAYNVVACPSIIGTWKSSKELSMKYNLANAELESKQIEFLSQTLGILTQTFSETEIHSHGAPTINISINGKSYNFEFEDIRYKYEILSCAESTLEAKAYFPYGNPIVNQMVFENSNTFWVSPEQLPKSREYFIRVQK